MPFALADPGSGEDLASRQIAIGAPTDFEQNVSAAWDASRLNDRFIGEQTAIAEEYDRYNEEVYRSTGQRLPNPIRGELPAGVNKMDITGDPRIPVPVELAIQQYEAAAKKAGAIPPTLADVQKLAHQRMADLEQRRGDIAARADETGGQFLGSSAAIMTDPPLLMSMMFGGGEAATVLGAIGREAALNMAVEAAVQPQIQSARIRAGLPGGLSQGLENVAMAGVGAAALTGAFRGGAAAYRALRGDAEKVLERTDPHFDADTVDAARYTERYADLQAQNPLAETPEGTAEHVARLSAVQARLYGEDAPRITDEPVTLPLIDQAEIRLMGRESQLASEADDLRAQIAAAPKPTAESKAASEALARVKAVEDQLANPDLTPAERKALATRRDELLTNTNPEALQAKAGPAEALTALMNRGARTTEDLARIRESLAQVRAAKIAAPKSPAAPDVPIGAVSHIRSAITDVEVRRKVDTVSKAMDRVAAGAKDLHPATPDAVTDHTPEAIERAATNERTVDFHAERDEQITDAAIADFRQAFEGRGDEPVYLENNGEMRAVRAADVFKAIDDQENLVKEFTNCVARAATGAAE